MKTKQLPGYVGFHEPFTISSWKALAISTENIPHDAIPRARIMEQNLPSFDSFLFEMLNIFPYFMEFGILKK